MKLLGLGFLLLIAIAGIVRSTSRPQIVTVDIRLLGYTNNVNGVRSARFDIQNNSAVTIDRSEVWSVQVSSSTGWSKLPGSQQQGSHQHLPGLPPGESEVMEVPVPNTTAPWRLSVMYFNHQSPYINYWRLIRYKLGLKPKDDLVTYVFESDPITP